MRKLSFRDKLLLVGITLTVCPLIICSAVTCWQNAQLREAASSGCRRAAEEDLSHIADNVYQLCEDSRAALEYDVRENLHSASVLLEEAGTIRVGAGTPVNWEARNQFTKAIIPVSLPQFLVGKTWLRQISDTQTFVPVVDSVRTLTKATSTIFQRMNPEGDMLRVATNVIGDSGTRAIGTFIPALGPDGKPNPVVSTVLRRETFVGRAFVVNAWYMAAYEPLLDTDKRVIGMLYVGVPEALATQRLRRAILNTKVGNSGYVFVLNAVGTTRGQYVISQGGERDRENLWNAKDSHGDLFMQEICRKAVTLNANEMITRRYPWKNPADRGLYPKIARIKYFKAWDWVIGVSIPEVELYAKVATVEQISHSGLRFLLVMAFATLVVSCAIWYFLANGLTRHTGRIIQELTETSTAMSSAAAQVSTSSKKLAHDAKEQAASNESVTSSLEQMGQMARTSLEDSNMLKQLAEEARDAAEGGSLQVHAMTEAMSQIQSAGADVVKINKLIGEIAFQTNILSLNAAVEAARAGDAGLGFAVVADEVRNLARRCAEAAQETSEKIQKSMRAGQQGVSVTSEVAEKLEVITASTRKLNELARAVAAASEQQSQGITQINASANQMNHAIQSTAATAKEGAGRANQFGAQARAIDGLAIELSEMFQRRS